MHSVKFYWVLLNETEKIPPTNRPEASTDQCQLLLDRFVLPNLSLYQRPIFQCSTQLRQCNGIMFRCYISLLRVTIYSDRFNCCWDAAAGTCFLSFLSAMHSCFQINAMKWPCGYDNLSMRVKIWKIKIVTQCPHICVFPVFCEVFSAYLYFVALVWYF